MKYLLVVLFSLSFNLYAKEQLATFAGGCFWCMEPPFEKLVGVKSVYSGYSGGEKMNPAYEDVASGKTKHRESVQITYDDEIVSYARLVEIFFQNINPTDAGGQFVDRGFQYSPAIFVHNDEQKMIAENAIKTLETIKKFPRPIKTPVITYKNFYLAEDYHQDYYKKNLLTKAKYKYYRNASGRDDYIKKYWKEGDTFLTDTKYLRPSDQDIKMKLNAMSFKVTQQEGTEPPFENEFWDNKKEGIYVDIVSGEPLFSSRHKYKSGTGWPSFYRPLDPNHIVEKMDNHLLSERIEVRSRIGNSHLGHVFNDGPKPSGLRYCINSAALRFIPKEELEQKGYSEFVKDFAK